MEVETVFEVPWPPYIAWHELTDRALRAFEAVIPEYSERNLAVCVLFADDARLQELNGQWRGKDRPTNVLSFPMIDPEPLPDYWDEDYQTLPLGDIALALQTCHAEAKDKEITLEHHAAHLIIHGLLHLAGYDHETSPEDAAEMEALEIKALALMGIPDPYGDHGN